LDETRTDISLLAEKGEPSFPGVIGLHADDAIPVVSPRVILSACRVGRSPEMELPIDDERLSRAHATIERAGSGFHVRDLGSHNGTFVDGKSAAGQGLHAIPGAVVRVARSLLLLVGNVRSYAPDWQDRAVRGALVGGPALDDVRRYIQLFASEASSLLLEGETGSGKERVAHAVHEQSGRSGALVAVNCAAIPRDLVESELFGHVRGAFSGANQVREGLLRQAHRGTLLLDEIGELPLETQAKLLRALEDGAVRAVGGDEPVPVDVRVVAATNRDLDEQVNLGAFRADLLYRLAGLRIRLPPLRERRDDIPVLCRYFLGGSLEISTSAMEVLTLARWPGNVRQLKSAIESAALKAKGRRADRIQREDLDPSVATNASAPQLDERDVELRARVETALTLRNGNVSHVGRDLGLHRARLYELFERLGIDPTAYRKS
jgi:DNA-binding NtrC family response regulator